MIYTLDAAKFVQGMSQSYHYSDKGFSPLSIGLEVSRRGTNYGLLRAGRSGTDLSTNLADNVVAITPYYQNSTFTYIGIGDAGKAYWTTVGASIAHTVKATIAKTFDINSDIIVYNGKVYLTTTTDVIESTLDFATVDDDWWTATKSKTALTSGVPHILLEYSGFLWIANGNKLWRYDGTTCSDSGNNTLTLPTNWIITDIRVYNNYLYIAASYYSKGQYNTSTKIFVWNGYSSLPIEEIPLDTMGVDFMRVVDGVLYFEAGGRLYQLNGKQYSRIYSLPTYPSTVNWKQAIVNGSNLYFTGYNGVWCFDSIIGAISVPIYTTATIKCLGNALSDFLEVFSTTNKCYWYVNNDGTSGTFYTNWIDFGKNVFIRKIEIIFESALSSGATYTAIIAGEKATVLDQRTISYAADGAIIKKLYQVNIELNMLRYQISIEHANCKAIKVIRIHYDPAERNNSK